MRKTVCLHGFLGRPTDWIAQKNRICPDLFAEPIATFEKWAKKFCDALKEPVDLVGYSMGGRLALHAFEEVPEKFLSLTLLSTHFGLPEEMRAERLAADQRWSARFRKESWDKLMEDWEAQPVFAGERRGRKESDYSRDRLAAALDIWSLGRQKDFRSLITESTIPIRYLVGEKDEKFRALSSTLSPSLVEVVPNRGHRLESVIK